MKSQYVFMENGTVQKRFHYEFRRVFDRVPFISIRKNEVEVGYGVHAITFGRWDEGGGIYIAWT